jgi:ferredoxin, 2Fe-2S
MVKIVIENLGKKELLVNDMSQTVLQQVHTHFVDWMHACGGKGRCTTCKMIVVHGGENLSVLTEAEVKYKHQRLLGDNERLACQTRITGDIAVRIAEENKFPHVKYSE